MIDTSDAINQAIGHYLSTVYTCIPAEVVEYDANKKMVTIKPLIKVKFTDESELSMPKIYSVPVIFPSTKNTIIQYEIKAKDTGLALFSTRSMELWLKGDGSEVSTGSPRKFSLNDAIFLPGLFAFGGVGKVGTGSGLEILHHDAKIVLKDDGTVNINGDTKNFVTHAELDTALQTFKTALNSHTHPTAGSGPPSPPTVPMSIDITAAKTLKVKTG
jgi:hypothetical protein